MRDEWFDLPGGFAASIFQGRTRRGVVPPPRFILLGPMPPDASRLRKTLAAGAFICGKIALDFGVLSAELERELGAAFERWCA